MQLEFNWNTFVKEVSKKISSERLRTWVEPLQFIEINDENLIIAAESDFIKDLVPQICGPVFHEVLSQNFGLDLKLKFVLFGACAATDIDSDSPVMLSMLQKCALSAKFNEMRAEEEDESVQEDPPQEPLLEAVEAGIVSSKAIPIDEGISVLRARDLILPSIKTVGLALNPKYTFENFIVGSSNEFACAAAKSVAENSSRQFNQLFFHGNSGLGKTHLLHAIGNEFLRFNPGAKICYVSAENFVNDLIGAIHQKKTMDFRRKYRQGYDVLLMDDIQFIAGKPASQDEFFHTFNALYSAKKYIVVTSDKNPCDIPGLEERIRTRFQWGLIVDIQSPDIETRLAILRNKALSDDIYLPDDVAHYLATHIQTNVCQIEGTLLRLGARASLLGVEVSLEMAKQELKDIVKQNVEHMSCDSIINAVCKHFGIKLSEIKSKNRSRNIALPRQIAMYFLRKHSDKSLYEIGLLLGGKDHSTIHHGIKTITQTINANPDVKSHVDAIQNSF